MAHISLATGSADEACIGKREREPRGASSDIVACAARGRSVHRTGMGREEKEYGHYKTSKNKQHKDGMDGT